MPLGKRGGDVSGSGSHNKSKITAFFTKVSALGGGGDNATASSSSLVPGNGDSESSLLQKETTTTRDPKIDDDRYHLDPDVTSLEGNEIINKHYYWS